VSPFFSSKGDEMFYLVLVAALAGFGYLVYKNGFDGAVAVVTAGVVAVAAYLEGMFDKIF
jgi:hypothetical protein